MARIPLDDSRWSDLLGGYGTNENFPKLIAEMMEDETPSSDLWDALHHQGDVNLGSYAALPYILDRTEQLEPAQRTEFLGLAGTILALSEAERNPKPEGEIAAQMQAAHVRLGTLALEALQATQETDEYLLGILLGSVAVAKGHARLGNVLLDWTGECPECGATLDPLGDDQ
ncbi:hypothetical protein [Deinococcus cavernae]|uniref:hypothetical protein n=1 Tax=Deinococcus cavernae TaxID=2320857 RepID=UPI0011C22EAA|nr:hypothetical protein [Deinococcus cavernae]